MWFARLSWHRLACDNRLWVLRINSGFTCDNTSKPVNTRRSLKLKKASMLSDQLRTINAERSVCAPIVRAAAEAQLASEASSTPKTPAASDG